MYFIIALLLIVMDQVTKYVIVNAIDVYEQYPLIGSFLSLTHVQNTGGAFSLLADYDWGVYLLSAISLAVSVVIAVFLAKRRYLGKSGLSLFMSLLLAGTVGNLIDRLIAGYVIDFIKFDFGLFVFPVFNVADICIVIGTLGIAYFIIHEEEPKHQDASAALGDD